MRIEQSCWTAEGGWSFGDQKAMANAQLVFVFGSPTRIKDRSLLEYAHARYPNAYFFGCSTAGEIRDRCVIDDSLTLTACAFEHTTLCAARVRLEDFADSREAGQALGQALNRDGLSHVLVLSDGLQVNGSELVKGLNDTIPAGVGITGGLSGDGHRFMSTIVCDGSDYSSGSIVAVGFMGKRMRIGMGSRGGWNAFGPQRTVTKATANVLYELDGEPALNLYKKYLGDHAKDLPSSALLFPLTTWRDDPNDAVVRTVLSVCEADGSMTFAGDIPVGNSARFMKTNVDDLIDGAQDAALDCLNAVEGSPAQLAILISCVGRKLVLRNRVDEEVDAVADALGTSAVIGFYSYGEICPADNSKGTVLQNQTMTITTFSEI